MLLAIPVYERPQLVRYCFRTAAELELPDGSEIVVFDDASPALDAGVLIAEAGLPARLERLERNVGPSLMAAHILRRYLQSQHEHLLFLDSDMIANRQAVTDGLNLLGRFDGLLSLYNSLMHAGEPLAADLVGKQSLGNAGTLWRRGIAALALGRVGGSLTFDDAYSEMFVQHGVPMASVVRSRVQHLGISGSNNQYFGRLEHGLGFVPDSPAQLEAIAATYDGLMSQQASHVPKWRRLTLRQRLVRFAKRTIGRSR